MNFFKIKSHSMQRHCELHEEAAVPFGTWLRVTWLEAQLRFWSAVERWAYWTENSYLIHHLGAAACGQYNILYDKLFFAHSSVSTWKVTKVIPYQEKPYMGIVQIDDGRQS